MRRALQKVRTLPGVEHASLAVGSPFGYAFSISLFLPGGDSVAALEGGGPYISAVSDGYFETVGTRLLRGRTVTASDGPESEPVAIVNTTMAKLLWSHDNPIGKCLIVGSPTAPCARVVGIVEDAHRETLHEPPAMQYYIPFGQERGFGGTVALVRPHGRLTSLVLPLRRTLSGLDGLLESVNVVPLEDHFDALVRPWRLGATMFSLGGGLALLVAGLGLYSVLSYLVVQRTHEIGVRMALGAGGRQIMALVLRDSLLTASVGIALGVAAAWYAGRYLEGLLFETSAHDPGVLVAAALTLLSAATAAALLPALRARRVDPMRAPSAE
jgi:putative ABC transport system permease protein